MNLAGFTDRTYSHSRAVPVKWLCVPLSIIWVRKKKNVVAYKIPHTLFHFEAQKVQYLHWPQSRHHSSLWFHLLNPQELSTNHSSLSAAECGAPLGAGSHNKWSFCFLLWFYCCTTYPSRDHPAEGLPWTVKEDRMLACMLLALFSYTKSTAR